MREHLHKVSLRPLGSWTSAPSVQGRLQKCSYFLSPALRAMGRCPPEIRLLTEDPSTKESRYENGRVSLTTEAATIKIKHFRRGAPSN